MQNFMLAAGRRAAAGTAAAVAGAAAQPSASARELRPQVHERSCPQHRIHSEEDWLLTEFDKEVLIFKPYNVSEVDAAIAQVQALVAGPSMTNVEKQQPAQPNNLYMLENDLTDGGVSPAATDTTVGEEADLVLDLPVAGRPGMLDPSHSASVAASQEKMGDLLTIANKLLQRPGLQKEVFKCMIEDEEVRELMLKQSRHLDAYLTAVGIHNPGLLPDAQPSKDSKEGLKPIYRRPTAVLIEDSQETGQRQDVLSAIVDAIANFIDQTGSVLKGLGSWARDRLEDVATQLSALFSGTADTERTEGESTADATACRRDRPRGTADTVLGAVMVVTVAVMCVLIARRPAVLARTVVVAAGAAAGHQAAQSARTFQ